jgi:ATP-dependent RNA helicase DDX54/DBP10
MKSKTGGGASGGDAKKKPSGGVKKKGKPRREALEDDEDFGGGGAGGGDAPEDAPILSGVSTDAGEVDFGFERTEALTGRRRKAEKAKGKGGGFESMDLLPEVFRAVKRKGYRIPTPIQRKAIPVALAGADVVAMARTGSGKTAAFLIPMLHKLRQHSLKAGARAVVLSPTRELALQTFKFAQELLKFTDLRAACVVGGDSMEAQFSDLASNPDLIVATPGRLLHMVDEVEGFTIRSVTMVCLDEADRLLEMGFSDQLRDILRQVAEMRQTLLFSATMPTALAEFVRVGLREPQVIRLDAEMKVSSDLKLSFTVVRVDEKIPALLYVLREVVPPKQQTVVFAATRHHVELLVTVLESEGIKCSSVYGTMDFAARKLNIGKFRARKTEVLVVTDVAARGIDIPLLDNVVNFDFPPRPKLFVHRVGRVARAGRSGVAHSILVKEEMGFLVDLHLFLGRPLAPAATTPPASREEARRLVDDADEAGTSVVGAPPPTSLDLVADRVRDLFEARTELDGLRRACDNAYKLYQRTRGSAGNESVARGAEIVAEMGPSPMLCASLRDESQMDAVGLADIARQIRAYRPAATVFEADIAHAAKGQGLLAAAARKSSAMQAKRAAHDKHIDKAKETGHGIVARRRRRPDAVVGGESDGESDDESDGEDDEYDEDSHDDEETENKQTRSSVVAPNASHDAFRVGAFRDDDFFLDVTPRGVNHTELGLSTMEDTLGRPMQDHLSLEGALAEATMDIVEEDGKGISQQRRVRIWDKKKRNYVQVNASEVDRARGGKRVKTESGAVVKKDEKAQGETYKKWQQRTHRSISATGSQEDPLASGGRGKTGLGRFKYRHTKGGEDDGARGGRGGRGRGGRF